MTEKSVEVIGHFIDGRIVAADAGRETVNLAVTAASRAAADWAHTPPQRRARVLLRFRELLERDAERIVAAIVDEHGKVWEDAQGELQRGIEIVEYACGASELLKGEHSRNAGPGIDSWSEFPSLGLVAGITPFNFPAMVPMWMLPMALACGNTFVLKPSEKDPSTSLLLAQLLTEAGLPAGAFNVVNGDKPAVDALLEDPRVQAISFVGSTPVAEYIYWTGTHHGKRVQALGGAKNHAVVAKDADLANAANALLGAAYGSCGERCMAISLVVVVGKRNGDALVERLATAASIMRIGPGQQRGPDMGPLINSAHRDKVRGYIDLGEQEGARVVVDGRKTLPAELQRGFFLGPTLLDHVRPTMRVYREEIFGPVLCVARVETLDEAVALVNGHEFGNGSCVFTRDGGVARRYSEAVQVGMVGVNVALPVPVSCHSFGGWKRSLFGDLCAYGPDAIRFYTRRKTTSQRWPDAPQAGAEFAFPGAV